MTDDEYDRWANGQIKNEFNQELKKAQILKLQQIEQNISKTSTAINKSCLIFEPS